MRPRPPLPTRTDEELERAPENQPRGIAVAVVFDWALATLCIALVVLAITRYGINSRQAAVTIFLALIAGLPLLFLGEALRRGRGGLRIVQIAVSGLIGGFNVIGVVVDLLSILHGERPR